MLLLSIIQSNELLIYIGESIVDRLLQCLRLVGPQGNVIGIEMDSQIFPQLVQSIHEYRFENNTLLLNSLLTDAIHDVNAFDSALLSHCYSRSHANAMTPDCTRFLQLSLSRVYDIIGGICPSQVIFGSISMDLDALEHPLILTGLFSGQRLIKGCKPMITVENVTSRISQALIYFLEGHGYHDIYWLLSPQSSDQDSVTVSIIANAWKRSLQEIFGEIFNTSDNVSNLISARQLFPYQRGKYYLHEVSHGIPAYLFTNIRSLFL